MSEPSSVASPAAVTKAYDILLWLINHVGKFTRSHRFVLAVAVVETQQEM
jgi:hypothetical protein